MTLAIDRGNRSPPAPQVGEVQYIRLGQVLEIQRNHYRKEHVVLVDHPRSPRDCRIVSQRDTRQFHFGGPERWASYDDISSAFHLQKGYGGSAHSTPFTEDFVFAPVKVVMAERDGPMRAVLSYDPVYPTRGRLGKLNPEQPLWLAYAAVAVLNSAFGQALYRRGLARTTGRKSSPDGLAESALLDIPVASQDYTEAELALVTQLAHQLGLLYEARKDFKNIEALARIDGFIRAYHGHLLIRCGALLHLGEEDEQQLIREVEGLNLLDAHLRETQPGLWDRRDELPPVPPVELCDLENHIRYQQLGARVLTDTLAGKDRVEFEELKRLKFWDEAVRTSPPRDIPQTPPHYDSRHPLWGAAYTYLDPMEPVALDDWEALQ